MKWVWHVAHMGKIRNEYTVLVRKIEVKTPLERPLCRWEGNSEMNLLKIRAEGVWTAFMWLRIRTSKSLL
jgi:hypothetical protein